MLQSLVNAASKRPMVAAVGTGIATAIVSGVALAMTGDMFGTQRISMSIPRSYKGDFYSEMTKGEAALILGVSRSASTKEVQSKHKKLLLTNHPDKGGSSLLASKINEAKDVLTGKKK